MNLHTIVILAGIVTVLLIEGIVYMTFRKRMEGLYPLQVTESHFFRFFTRRHIVIVALAHTTLMLIIFVGALFFLW